MILSLEGAYGDTIVLSVEGEIEGFQFIPPPLEYRFVRRGEPEVEWTTADSDFQSLLRPVIEGSAARTRGLRAEGLTVETRGLCGRFTLLIWPRM